MSKAGALNLASGLGGKIDKKEVISAVDQYEKYHVHYGGEQEVRKANYTDMVNKYYDLATSFYEYGWGESFHFADRWKGESLRESIKRHEHFLALQLSLKPGMKVLDVGCGIGGPLREIARFRDTNWSDPGPNLGGSRAPIRIQHRTCRIWIRMSWIPYAWMRIRISPRSKNRLHTHFILNRRLQRLRILRYWIAICNTSCVCACVYVSLVTVN